MDKLSLKIISSNQLRHFKQLIVPFMIYADFESLLKRVKGNNRKK